MVTSDGTPGARPAEACVLLDSTDVPAYSGVPDRHDRAHGPFVPADRRGARHGGRGGIHTEPPAAGAARRSDRQRATGGHPDLGWPVGGAGRLARSVSFARIWNARLVSYDGRGPPDGIANVDYHCENDPNFDYERANG